MMNVSLRRGLALLSLLLLSGWAGAAPYRMGAGDIVRVSVYGNPDLSLEAEIAADGRLNVPLLGQVPMAGLSFDEGERLLAERWRAAGVLSQPHVNLLVTEYRSQLVSVWGEVNRPGQYPLKVDTRLSGMLAAAGGVAPTGGQSIELVRGNQRTRYELGAEGLHDDPLLQPGDQLVVPRQPQVYVYGEVLRPGSYPLGAGLTVMQSIALAGGFTPRADHGDISLQHQDANGELVNQAVTLTTGLKADAVIFVGESWF